MKKIILSIVILMFNTSLFSHVGHYPDLNYLEYELTRNGKLIGKHTYDFKRDKNKTIINSDVSFKIVKLGIELYKYEAKGKEIYENGNFLSFESKTNQNKKNKFAKISFNKEKNELIIEGSSFNGIAPKDFIVGTWWNHEIIKSKAQISAVSGRIIKQNVNFVGKETINVNGNNYNTLRFNFSSSDPSLSKDKKLNTDIWYEENTYLWVKASFEKMGTWEYRLKSYK